MDEEGTNKEDDAKTKEKEGIEIEEETKQETDRDEKGKNRDEEGIEKKKGTNKSWNHLGCLHRSLSRRK